LACARDRILLQQLALLKEHAAKSSADTVLVVFFPVRLITALDLGHYVFLIDDYGRERRR
jgi:hypothetical protein